VTTRARPANPRCVAINRNGERCQAYAIHGSQYCFHHAPEVARERSLAHARGGKSRQQIRDVPAPDPKLQTPDQALRALEFALALAYQMQPGGAKVRAIVSVVGAWRGVYEVAELEGRVRALETLVGGGAP